MEGWKERVFVWRSRKRKTCMANSADDLMSFWRGRSLKFIVLFACVSS